MKNEIVYCLDNSYAYNQRTGKNEYLACTVWGEAKPVRIILSPFKMSVDRRYFGGNSMHEFVVVEDEKGDRHVVLNNFLYSKQEAHDHYFRMRESFALDFRPFIL